jgi:hypothetical protein
MIARGPERGLDMPMTILSLGGSFVQAPVKGNVTKATSVTAIRLNNTFFVNCFSSFQNFAKNVFGLVTVKYQIYLSISYLLFISLLCKLWKLGKLVRLGLCWKLFASR